MTPVSRSPHGLALQGEPRRIIFGDSGEGDTNRKQVNGQSQCSPRLPISVSRLHRYLDFHDFHFLMTCQGAGLQETDPPALLGGPPAALSSGGASGEGEHRKVASTRRSHRLPALLRRVAPTCVSACLCQGDELYSAWRSREPLRPATFLTGSRDFKERQFESAQTVHRAWPGLA